MGLLQSNAAPVPQQPMQGEGAGVEDQINGESDEGKEGFTIRADEVEKAIKSKMDKQQVSNLDRVLDAGNELLFGKDTHYQFMQGLENSQDIGGDVGKGAVSFTLILLKQSANMPGDVIIPAGVILIARVFEFINQSGMAEVDDDDFEEATHVFTVLLSNQLDPAFKDKMAQQQPTPAMPDQSMQQPMQQPPAQGGLLTQGA